MGLSRSSRRRPDAKCPFLRQGRSNVIFLLSVAMIGAYFTWNQREMESIRGQPTETVPPPDENDKSSTRTKTAKANLEEDLEEPMDGNDDDDRMAQDFNLEIPEKKEGEDDDLFEEGDEEEDEDDGDDGDDDGDDPAAGTDIAVGDHEGDDNRANDEAEDNGDAAETGKQPLSTKDPKKEKGGKTSEGEKVKRFDATKPSMWNSLEMALTPNVETAAIRGPKPLFQCSPEKSTATEKKLIFVHIFKTAGSTLRSFFTRYAAMCHVGYAAVTRCSDALYRSMTSFRLGKRSGVSPAWISTSTKSYCPVRFYVPRIGEPSDTVRVARTFFLRDKVDIIAGHVPLGAGMVYEREVYPLNLHGKDGEVKKSRPFDSKVRYVTFFRNAVHKFVSGVSYHLGKQATEEKLLEEVRRKVTQARSQGQYQLKYAEYLLTPQQREERIHKQLRLTAADVTTQVMQNILDYDVVCGITELMSESLAMIEYMIDAEGSASELFDQYGREPHHAMTKKQRHMQSKSAQRQRTLQEHAQTRRLQKHPTPKRSQPNPRSNASQVSTSAMVAKLEEDKEFYAKLVEYVKYEQQVTDFAIAVHQRQFELLKKERSRKQ